MADLKAEDLGNGFTLTFQRQEKTEMVRAVVKSATGEIVTRGPVVSEREAARSKFMAVSEWMETHLPKPEPVPEDSDEDLDEDLDEEESDYDEELL